MQAAMHSSFVPFASAFEASLLSPVVLRQLKAWAEQAGDLPQLEGLFEHDLKVRATDILCDVNEQAFNRLVCAFALSEITQGEFFIGCLLTRQEKLAVQSLYFTLRLVLGTSSSSNTVALADCGLPFASCPPPTTNYASCFAHACYMYVQKKKSKLVSKELVSSIRQFPLFGLPSPNVSVAPTPDKSMMVESEEEEEEKKEEWPIARPVAVRGAVSAPSQSKTIDAVKQTAKKYFASFPPGPISDVDMVHYRVVLKESPLAVVFFKSAEPVALPEERIGAGKKKKKAPLYMGAAIVKQPNGDEEFDKFELTAHEIKQRFDLEHFNVGNAKVAQGQVLTLVPGKQRAVAKVESDYLSQEQSQQMSLLEQTVEEMRQSLASVTDRVTEVEKLAVETDAAVVSVQKDLGDLTDGQNLLLDEAKEQRARVRQLEKKAILFQQEMAKQAQAQEQLKQENEKLKAEYQQEVQLLKQERANLAVENNKVYKFFIKADAQVKKLQTQVMQLERKEQEQELMIAHEHMKEHSPCRPYEFATVGLASPGDKSPVYKTPAPATVEEMQSLGRSLSEMEVMEQEEEEEKKEEEEDDDEEEEEKEEKTKTQKNKEKRRKKNQKRRRQRKQQRKEKLMEEKRKLQ